MLDNKKKVIFIILVFGLLFFKLNANLARAEGAAGPCNGFCEKKCPKLKKSGIDYDNGCRVVGVNGNNALCSCCDCNTVGNDLKCDCQCQNENKITDCYVGGLFRDQRVAVCACCGDCTPDDLLYIGVSVAELILKYLGVIALAFFVLGGIIWITSGGSNQKVQKGMAILRGAIIGMIIVIVAYSMVRIIMKDVLKVDSKYLPEPTSEEQRTS